MKYFAISDMHSCYSQTIKALGRAGFDRNNPDHTLIVCGDAFDRGTQAPEMLDFLLSLERKVLIKGNHDDILMELLERKHPKMSDDRNGTTGTVYQLGYGEGITKFSDFCDKAYGRFAPIYNMMVDFFETENYIFVHSWIPFITERYGFAAFDDNWRNAGADLWKEARWANPFEMAENGLRPDKTIVFGHWHTSWPRAYYKGMEESGPDADFSIYYGKGYIGLDAMTASTGIVNVLIIEEDV
ncbi:MAG: metallophosphoesterase [Oscillospiraceae bacterium]|nr:metallophosphoesterase [Oscillospiraceae bacterium]